MKFIPAKYVHPVWFCVFMLSACLAFTGTSMAQNQYYVNSAAGSDSNDGSQTHPWKTIQHADSALALGAGGAVVHVAQGTYSGPVTTRKSGTASARIVYISDTKWGAKITNASWTEWGSFVDINGFDMTNPGSGVCIGLIGTQQTPTPATHVHVLGNYCHDVQTDRSLTSCTPTGAMNDGTGGSDDWWIGNVVRHTGWPTADPNSACGDVHGFYITAIRTLVENNAVSGTAGYGIQIRDSGELTSGYCCLVVSNNTLFNNNGGIVFDETGNTARAVLDYVTFTNNIIVNNGPGSTTGGRTGQDGVLYFHVSGTHWVAGNNLVYGNLPHDYQHHDTACTANGPFSGTDGEGNAGGCPNANGQIDANVNTTFVNFQTDTNTAPASNYNLDNYQIKAGSNAIQHGAMSCAAAPGLNPCVPTTDIVGVMRLVQTGSTLDIGAYAQTSAAVGLPSAPTGLTASVH
jgi:hypothetical protein